LVESPEDGYRHPARRLQQEQGPSQGGRLGGAGLGQRLANADISKRKRVDEFKSAFIAAVNRDLPTPSPR